MMDATFKYRLRTIMLLVFAGGMFAMMFAAILARDDERVFAANVKDGTVKGGLILDPRPIEDDLSDSGFGGADSGFGGGMASAEPEPIPESLVGLVAESADTPEVKLVEANNAFAVKLYKQLAKEQNGQSKDGPKSFCFSPYSVATLLQAIKVGTRGETEKELAKAMCLTIKEDELNLGYRTLLNLLQLSFGKAGFSRYYDDGSAALTVANKLWIQENEQSQVRFKFIQVLSRYYDCGFDEIDFYDSQEAASEINSWVAKETRGHIPEIIQANDIEDPTFFAAVNAVFFQGRWCEPFDSQETHTRPFYDSDGKTLRGAVPMMASESEGMSEVALVDGISVLKKSYRGGVSFVVLLPPSGEKEFENLESSLTVKKIAKCVGQTQYIELKRLELPKFELENTFSLIDVMKQLGVVKLFDDREADFSAMISKKSPWWPIWIYLLRHKATIQVDEEGTVATAASIGMGMGGGPLLSGRFIANRPFLFLIFDENTSSILFMGRYMGPEVVVDGS